MLGGRSGPPGIFQESMNWLAITSFCAGDHAFYAE